MRQFVTNQGRSWRTKSGCSDSGAKWGIPLFLRAAREKGWAEGTFLARLSVLVLASAAVAQQSPLEPIVRSMDRAAASFRSTEASFVWDVYTKIGDSADTDTQKGKAYFRRKGNGIEMAADITEPASEQGQILFRDSKVQLYNPRTDQVTVYNAGKNQGTVESFLVLGFGGSGQDMLKSFEVSYVGSEKVAGVETAKLQLVPKSQKLKNNLDHILLWIDPERGISLQQQFFVSESNYRLAKYSDIKLNEKISDDAFKLKTTSKTKVVSPQG